MIKLVFKLYTVRLQLNIRYVNGCAHQKTFFTRATQITWPLANWRSYWYKFHRKYLHAQCSMIKANIFSGNTNYAPHKIHQHVWFQTMDMCWNRSSNPTKLRCLLYKKNIAGLVIRAGTHNSHEIYFLIIFNFAQIRSKVHSMHYKTHTSVCVCVCCSFGSENGKPDKTIRMPMVVDGMLTLVISSRPS